MEREIKSERQVSPAIIWGRFIVFILINPFYVLCPDIANSQLEATVRVAIPRARSVPTNSPPLKCFYLRGLVGSASTRAKTLGSVNRSDCGKGLYLFDHNLTDSTGQGFTNREQEEAEKAIGQIRGAAVEYGKAKFTWLETSTPGAGYRATA